MPEAPRFWGAPRCLSKKKMKTLSQKMRGSRKCAAPENAERESAGPQKMWGPSKRGARKRGGPKKWNYESDTRTACDYTIKFSVCKMIAISKIIRGERQGTFFRASVRCCSRPTRISTPPLQSICVPDRIYR